MIYLTTGANGAGKTLLTLRDVRAQQLKENRPVYYHGFEALQPIKDFGWQPFEPENWQDLPDGSILIFDECQNEFPAEKGPLPAHINAIAQFRRKRGFDFWLITPHPMMLNVFIRRLIEKPSWHRHLKRAFGADLVSVLKWSAPNVQCEKPGAGETGEVSMVAYPKEVYGWYQSASLHTGKRKIPFRFWLMLAVLLAAPAAAWYAYSSFMGNAADREAKLAAVAGKKPAAGPGGPQQQLTPPPPRSEEKKPMTAGEYAASFAPRIPGLPYTAPRYDELTRAQDVPRPAACIDGIRPGAKIATCKCWTQQATPIDMPDDLCKQIASKGYFDDTLAPASRLNQSQSVLNQKSMATQPAAAAEPPAPAVMGLTPTLPPLNATSTISRDAEVLAFMAKRKQIP